MNAIKVGKSISILRKKYGMTQVELAKRLSVTDKAVSRWERGIGMPDTSLLVKLSIILDVDIETLLEGNVVSDDLEWKGVLLLNYPNDVSPGELVFTKRIIYIQLCYFLLAGITNILVIGRKDKIDVAKSHIARLGTVRVRYEVSDDEMDLNVLMNSARIRDYNKEDGIMVLSGFDLVYGKDFTKALRRVMNNSRKPTRICTFEQTPTSFIFFPRGTISQETTNDYCFERGVICLPVKQKSNLIEAGNLIRIIESCQNESYMDMEMIAERRHIKNR